MTSAVSVAGSVLYGHGVAGAELRASDISQDGTRPPCTSAGIADAPDLAKGCSRLEKRAIGHCHVSDEGGVGLTNRRRSW